MSWVLCGILLIIIILLIIKQNNKNAIDRSEAEKYQQELAQLRDEKQALIDDIKENSESLIIDYQNKISEIQSKYHEALNKKTQDLDLYFENQKVTRQSEMDTDFERLWREKEEVLKSKYLEFEREELEREHEIQQKTQLIIDSARESQENILAETRAQQERFEGLLQPLKQYEMKQQERLFYTIQVPEEYKEDINFLLTTVAAKVQHPDIINKLVWAEYVKPYIDDTFKRVGVKDECGIYKLTSLINGKCYIGKSTNIKKRIADHFKASIKLESIAHQAVHDEISRIGFWNWTIEVITYCEKERLSELEKYYISFFKSQEWGFNKNQGG